MSAVIVASSMLSILDDGSTSSRSCVSVTPSRTAARPVWRAGLEGRHLSIAIASNQAFSGWTNTFTDPRLCAAIIDRLTFAGLIIETGTQSYRLAHARARRGAAS